MENLKSELTELSRTEAQETTGGKKYHFELFSLNIDIDTDKPSISIYFN
jgi:hypothetical protein